MRNEVTERSCRGGIHRAELLGNGCQKVDLLSLHSPFPEMDILNGLFKVSHFFNVSHCLTFGYNIRPGCFERARERLVTNCKQFLPKSLSWISGPGSLKLKLKLNFNFLKLNFEMHKKFNMLFQLNFLCIFIYCEMGNKIKVQAQFQFFFTGSTKTAKIR